MSNNVLSRLFRSLMPYNAPYSDPDEHYNRKASGGSVRTSKPSAAEKRAADICSKIGVKFGQSAATHGAAETATHSLSADAVFISVLQDGVRLAREAGAAPRDIHFAKTLIQRTEQVEKPDVRSIYEQMLEQQGWRQAPLEQVLINKAHQVSTLVEFRGAKPPGF